MYSKRDFSCSTAKEKRLLLINSVLQSLQEYLNPVLNDEKISFLVIVPSLSSEDIEKNAEHSLTIKYNIDKNSCFAFEYFIEGTSVFEIKLSSTADLDHSYEQQIIRISPEGN